MLIVLILAVLGLYVRRLRNRIKVLERCLGEALTDLEARPKALKTDLTWVASSIIPTAKAKKTRKRKPKLIDDMDLDGLPLTDV